ncbi:MAG: hypothetical protein OS130_13395 [Thermodesulfobacteriota bacterium]|nr:MAG: hypothetical protein OS130_13395 [Thermodesulfobacteriota bacterium]
MLFPSRGRDVVLNFQPLYNLFGCIYAHLSAFYVKVGQYLVQANNSDLGIINKP